MSVHIQATTTERVSLSVWIYSGVPDDAPAFRHRLDYDASCTAIWHPRERHAYIQGLSLDCFGPRGRLEHGDYVDLSEHLHTRYGVQTIEWDRADGKKLKKRRVGARRWVACDGSRCNQGDHEPTDTHINAGLF